MPDILTADPMEVTPTPNQTSAAMRKRLAEITAAYETYIDFPTLEALVDEELEINRWLAANDLRTDAELDADIHAEETAATIQSLGV